MLVIGIRCDRFSSIPLLLLSLPFLASVGAHCIGVPVRLFVRKSEGTSAAIHRRCRLRSDARSGSQSTLVSVGGVLFVQ